MNTFTLLLVLVCFIAVCMGMSDVYGHNPQHEFGSVFGQTNSPLIPFWKLEGDAFANQDYVRLVPDRQSKRGGMWNSEANRFYNWEATFSIHLHGVGSFGADGMAFWYTKETNKLNGGFFGFTDQFTGLGIVLDTYDNDNTGLHPLLVAIVNDGSKKYTHQHHSEEEGGSPTNMEVGNCQLPIRNLAGTSFIRVTYRSRQLKVETQVYGKDTFTICMVANDINLPPQYHFGFTAATGQLADNHDVYGFSLRNLDMNAPSIDSQRIFSTYDKYQVADYLSKIHFAISNLETSDSSKESIREPRTHGNGDASLGTELNDLATMIRRVEGSVLEIANLVKLLESRTPSFSSAQVDVATIKSGVTALLSRLPATSGQNEANASKMGFDSSSKASSVWTVVLYTVIAIVVLVLCYVAVLVYRSKVEREKKFF